MFSSRYIESALTKIDAAEPVVMTPNYLYSVLAKMKDGLFPYDLANCITGFAPGFKNPDVMFIDAPREAYFASTLRTYIVEMEISANLQLPLQSSKEGKLKIYAVLDSKLMAIKAASLFANLTSCHFDNIDMKNTDTTFKSFMPLFIFFESKKGFISCESGQVNYSKDAAINVNIYACPQDQSSILTRLKGYLGKVFNDFDVPTNRHESLEISIQKQYCCAMQFLCQDLITKTLEVQTKCSSDESFKGAPPLIVNNAYVVRSI
jgi:hypothetical protein